VLGYYGKLLGPVDPNVMDRIVANGAKDIPLKPKPLEPLLPSMRKKYPSAADDEILLRVMFAGNQVDEMKTAAANGRPVAQSNILDSLKTVLSDKRKGSVFIKRGDLELSVSVQ
jgi:oxaloacetate decarboxylase alpha subunit